MELYKKYRPQELRGVVGQKNALLPIVELGKKKKLPHTILFSGPSGVGKTTTARILAKKVKCKKPDLHEMDAAQVRGIDAIREIADRIRQLPIAGESSVWIIDEVHQLTGAAVDSFLKILEDTPSYIYFFLCTTNPEKLKRTILTRCHQVKMVPINDLQMRRLLVLTAKAEGFKLNVEVVDKITENSGGSARQALVYLNAVLLIPEPEDQLNAIGSVVAEASGIDLARLLVKNQCSWRQLTDILGKLKPDDVETVRWTVMGYCRSILLKEKNPLAARVLDLFLEPFYESKMNGLVAACWRARMEEG